MNVQDLKQMRQLFNEGFEQVVLPHIERVDGEPSEIKGELKDHTTRLERI